MLGVFLFLSSDGGLSLNPAVSDWLDCLTSEFQGLSSSPAHSLTLALYIAFEALESYL